MFRIYAKHKTDKRFSAMDMDKMVQVGNLIYASIFDNAQRVFMSKEVINMMRINPEYKFEIRDVK